MNGSCSWWFGEGGGRGARGVAEPAPGPPKCWDPSEDRAAAGNGAGREKSVLEGGALLLRSSVEVLTDSQGDESILVESKVALVYLLS